MQNAEFRMENFGVFYFLKYGRGVVVPPNSSTPPKNNQIFVEIQRYFFFATTKQNRIKRRSKYLSYSSRYVFEISNQGCRTAIDFQAY